MRDPDRLLAAFRQLVPESERERPGVDALEARARRRTRRARAQAIVAVAVVLAVIVALAVTLSSTNTATTRVVTSPDQQAGRPLPKVGAPGTYVGVGYELDLFDAASGAVLKKLLRLPSRLMHISGTALDRHGHLWVTLSQGPQGPPGGDLFGSPEPQPHTCASEVVELDPRTGSTKVMLRGSDNEVIEDAQPSPDGKHLAYLTSGCVQSYYSQWLRIDDLRGGPSVTIGAGLKPCYVLLDPRWTADGRHVSMVFGAPESNVPHRSEDGIDSCSSIGRPAGIVVVSASKTQAGVSGPSAPPDAGCMVAAATPDASGFAAVERCGDPTQEFIDGAVKLVRFDRHLRAVDRRTIGECGDGESIAVDRSGKQLVFSTYSPPCEGQSFAANGTTAFTADAASGPPIKHSFVGLGTTDPNDLAW